jgi:predicted alpha/beta hydrolase family esterase
MKYYYLFLNGRVHMKIVHIIHCILFASSYLFCASEKQPTTLYCHGLNGKPSKVKSLVERNIIQAPARSFSFDDKKQCLGQANDIETLKNQIEACDENHILYGHSLGGARIIKGLAQHNFPNVQAIIIDASPADVIDRVHEIQCAAGAYPFRTRAQKEWILRQLYPDYPKNSIPPVASIFQIRNKSLPVFLVHSENDDIINARAAGQNYKAFKQAQFPHVYLCMLKHGGHNHNTKGADNQVYKTALHSFYKKHNLQYDPKQATLEDLSHLQPTIEDVDKQIAIHENKLQEKFRNQRTLNIAIGIHAAFIITAIMRNK